MKLYYIANARMPTEKAHGIQIAKMCEAFIEAGIDLTLVVPRRATEPQSLQEYYALRVPVPLIRLPVIDWYTGGRIGYFISSLSFMLSYVFFIGWKKIKEKRFVLYTVDMDNYSSSALTFFNTPLFSEMHGAKPYTIAQRILFRRVNGIVAINKIIVEELQKKFSRSRAHYIIEPNGVDLSEFADMGKQNARERLGLPQDAQIVLYAGRFFEWKGLEILPRAAAMTPSIRWQIVGGVEEDFKRLVREPLPMNLFFKEGRPHSEMPLWFAAADALVVLGTVRDIQSYRYTSPMKLFEYLATRRPIIASNTPAIREIVKNTEVLFYTPDDTHDLARVAEYAVMHKEDLRSLTDAAMRHAAASSWHARAERIMQFMQEKTRLYTHV